MYIYTRTPHVHHSEEGSDAEGGAMDSEQASISRPHHHPSSPPPTSSLPSHPAPPSLPSRPLTFSSPSPSQPLPAVSSSPKHTLLSRGSRPNRQSQPVSFPPLFFQTANTSSASLVPSTAEGRPIPLDNATAEQRTSALRELNINFPSPIHHYGKSTGAQSATFSRPVIVRTYAGPSPSHSRSHSRQYRPPSASRGGSRRIPFSGASTTESYRSTATASQSTGTARIAPRKNGSVMSMSRANTKRRAPWHWQNGGSPPEDPDEPKLPPLEAFSFKGFMADLQAQGSEHDIAADLDRIAEICARSRYSLSNQYEVHVAPHGSGSGFATVASSSSGRRRRGIGRHQQPGGPTLQAVSSDDDENSARGYRRRRGGGRRKSVAYGTLETIMSSSRSSEEDKTKKKSATELAEEVRGRAARKGSDHSASGGSASAKAGTPSPNKADPGHGNDKSDSRKKSPPKKAPSFASAVIDTTRPARQGDAKTPRSSTAALVSQPAQPQASTSHLEIRTAPDLAYDDICREEGRPTSHHSSELSEEQIPLTSTHTTEEIQPTTASVLSGLSSWMPWGISAAINPPGQRNGRTPSQAAGSLRQLLSAADGKGTKGKAIVEPAS